MIGTAHQWHTFQKSPDRLQISSGVDGSGGERVEEAADPADNASLSTLSKLSDKNNESYQCCNQ
jgi:hypothetical protein